MYRRNEKVYIVFIVVHVIFLLYGAANVGSVLLFSCLLARQPKGCFNACTHFYLMYEYLGRPKRIGVNNGKLFLGEWTENKNNKSSFE